MIVEVLQDFLNHSEIPKIERPPKTFLEIAKQPHYENVLSNIYAFYFNYEEEHNLKGLFINSFIELIEKHQPHKSLASFIDFEVHTEYSTIKGGRIDVLITNGNHHLIIENKIYHHIEDNDLIDYWTTIVKQNQEDTSVGIILSLDKVDVTHKPGAKNFINITHLEFLTHVFKKLENNKLENYLEDANKTFLVFLKDFFQNIKNLSRKMIKIQDLEFYFKNHEKIDGIIKLNSVVANHIKKETEIAVSYIDGVHLDAPRANSHYDNQIKYYVSNDHENLRYMVRFNPLLEGKNKILIVIKLTNVNLLDYNISPSKEYDNLKDDEIKWGYIAKKEYTLTSTDVHNLSKFIERKINEDGFLSLFKKIEELLKK